RRRGADRRFGVVTELAVLARVERDLGHLRQFNPEARSAEGSFITPARRCSWALSCRCNERSFAALRMTAQGALSPRGRAAVPPRPLPASRARRRIPPPAAR